MVLLCTLGNTYILERVNLSLVQTLSHIEKANSTKPFSLYFSSSSSSFFLFLFFSSLPTIFFLSYLSIIFFPPVFFISPLLFFLPLSCSNLVLSSHTDVTTTPLTCAAVMIIDDDRWIELDDMLLLFLTWQVCSDTLNSHVILHNICN